MNAAIRGEPARLLGREDALGQVRAIEALFRSAAAGTTVASVMPGLRNLRLP